ncbi:hypothetical protein [Streptomyces sp. NPDC088789]|uniref:hypothetical protein n=1 Tax=Streptomyces sp. NPDC088789 TaxID=3365899 RepID=UPI00381B1FFD
MTGFKRVPAQPSRSRYSELYERYADLLSVDRLVGRWEIARFDDTPGDVSKGMRPVVTGEIPHALEFIATTSRGIVIWRQGGIQGWRRGRFFGITLQEGRAYSFHETGRHGRIVSLDLESNLGGEMVTHIWGLNRWIHQIDFIDDDLVVVDTLRNRFLLYPNVEDLRSRHHSARHQVINPTPRDRKGRRSPHYRTFNSVYRHEDRIYVVAHNHSVVTGRESEVWVFDKDWALLETLPTGGHCCHNVVSHEDGLVINHSLEQAVTIDGLEVAKTKGFNRGIAYNGEYILIGSSIFAEDHTQRDHDDAFVEVFDRNFKPVGQIVLPQCSLRDVRFLNGDRSLSNQ